ncbi:MAG TPA: hypothetical protein VF533_05960 [Solirubrobacteraceae bacterium]|jgi:hypothetical protein
MTAATTWSGSLHLSFRLLPEEKRSGHVEPFLSAHGKTKDQVLASLPYDAARAKGGGGSPNARRYRDGKQLYTTAGLLHEEDGVVHVTPLGQAVMRWLPHLTEANAPVLGSYAVYSLAACQLVNPTRTGRSYADGVEVFPCSFIWRAMLALDDKISSEELNRAVFKSTDEASLSDAIDSIAQARDEGDPAVMGDPVITGSSPNDRIISWISIASFGYTLIADKAADAEEGGTYYRIRPAARRVVSRAAAVRFRHRSDFTSVGEYVRYVSRMAGLPQPTPLAAAA